MLEGVPPTRVHVGFAIAWLCLACGEPQANTPAALAPEDDPSQPGPMAVAGDPAPGNAGSEAPASEAMAGAAGPGPTAGTASAPMAGSEAGQPEPLPDECEGFVVSRTAPCHNDPNPCGIDSGFPGDEYCLPPPAPGEGVQVHFGPSSYDDPAEVAKYTIGPQEEFNDYGVAPIPTTEERFYNRVVYQMRPGSHHLINSIVDGTPEPGFQASADCPGNRIGTLGGTQNLIYDSRPNGIVPPENEGLAYSLPPNANICFNYHRYNVTDADQLSEIWVNFYFVDEAEVTQRARWGAIIGGLGLRIPPGAEQNLTYEYTFSDVTPNEESPPRIIQLFGHRHASTYRFAAWLNDDLIYDSWDWQESVTYNYDSLSENTPPNPDLMIDGGHSGVLEVKSGDTLKYTCFIRNESDVTLRFANELYTGEMCNLFGQSVGTSFGGFNF